MLPLSKVASRCPWRVRGSARWYSVASAIEPASPLPSTSTSTLTSTSTTSSLLETPVPSPSGPLSSINTEVVSSHYSDSPSPRRGRGRPRRIVAEPGELERRLLARIASSSSDAPSDGSVTFSLADLSTFYSLRVKTIVAAGGASLLVQHGRSVLALLRAAYPLHPWEPDRFLTRPRSFWSSPEAQRAWLDQAAVRLGLGEGAREAWYGVHLRDLKALRAHRLLAHHGNSLAALLASAYPDHEWDASRFVKRPQRYWRDPEALRREVTDLAARLGLVSAPLSAWYTVSRDAVLRAPGGAALLAAHGSSLSRLLRTAFPEHPWDASQFKTRRAMYWMQREHVLAHLAHVRRVRGLGEDESDLTVWYALTLKDVVRHGARGLADHYPSLVALLRFAYPEHVWHSWRFPLPRRSRPAVLRTTCTDLVEHISARLGISSEHDWASVSDEQLEALGDGVLAAVRARGGLAHVLECSKVR